MLVRMPPLHRKQDEIRRSPARFKVLSCGRRFGKTMLAAVVAISCAISGGAVWWIGPTAREAGIGWRAMRGLSEQIPGVKIARAAKTITFPGGGWIAVLSAESMTLRGEGLDLVVIDEAAFLPSLLGTWQEDLRPALADRQGAAMFISTPNGRGDFYSLYCRAAQGQEGWASFQCRTADNPFIPQSEIEAARAELPDWVFAQEYLAEFVTFAGKVYKSFDPAGPCVFHGGIKTPQGECWGGIDFGFRNPTVVSIGDYHDKRLDVFDGLYAREITTEDLIPHVLAYQDKYKVRGFFCDPSEPGAIEQMHRAGIYAIPAPRTTGDKDKSSVRHRIITVETWLVNGRLRIWSGLPDMVREFDMYRYPDIKAGVANEMPLKVDDHAPDAVGMMVVGIEHVYSSLGSVVVI